MEGRALATWEDPPGRVCPVHPRVLPSGWWYSHEAEDDGASKGYQQDEGQGAQDGRDDDHATAAPAWPRVNRQVRGD